MEEVLMMVTSPMQQKPLWESQQSMKQVQHHASSFDDGNIWHVAWWIDGQSVMVARQMSGDHQCALIKKLVVPIQLRCWKCWWPMKQFHHKANSFNAQNVLYILIVWWAVRVMQITINWLGWYGRGAESGYHMTPWLLDFWFWFIIKTVMGVMSEWCMQWRQRIWCWWLCAGLITVGAILDYLDAFWLC